MSELINLIPEVLKAGSQLENASTWHNRANLTLSFVAIINVLVYLSKSAGYDLHLDTESVEALANGFSVIGVSAASFIHTAASKDAGVKNGYS